MSNYWEYNNMLVYRIAKPIVAVKFNNERLFVDLDFQSKCSPDYIIGQCDLRVHGIDVFANIKIYRDQVMYLMKNLPEEQCKRIIEMHAPSIAGLKPAGSLTLNITIIGLVSYSKHTDILSIKNQLGLHNPS